MPHGPPLVAADAGAFSNVTHSAGIAPPVLSTPHCVPAFNDPVQTGGGTHAGASPFEPSHVGGTEPRPHTLPLLDALPIYEPPTSPGGTVTVIPSPTPPQIV